MTIAPPPPAAWDGLDALRPDLERFLAARSRDRHAIDDAIQESFIRAARYRRALTQPEALRGWLRKIGLNALTDVHRGRRRRVESLPTSEEDELASPHPEPGDLCDEVEVRCAERTVGVSRARRLLERALGHLPHLDRHVLVSIYLDGDPRDEVARRLGLDANLLKTRLYRARLKLRRALHHELGLAS